MSVYDPNSMALKFDLGTFTPSESLWNMNVGRTCTFMFSTRAVLVTKQTYLKSLEIDKHRRTDYRYSHQAGESEREFSQCLMNVCVPTSVTLFGCSLTGGKGRSAQFSWKRLFRWSLRTETAGLTLGRQWKLFLLPCIAVCWLFVVVCKASLSVLS